MQEDVSQKVLQVSVTDSCAKKDISCEQSSFVLVDGVPKVSGDCVHIVDKE